MSDNSISYDLSNFANRYDLLQLLIESSSRCSCTEIFPIDTVQNLVSFQNSLDPLFHVFTLLLANSTIFYCARTSSVHLIFTVRLLLMQKLSFLSPFILLEIFPSRDFELPVTWDDFHLIHTEFCRCRWDTWPMSLSSVLHLWLLLSLLLCHCTTSCPSVLSFKDWLVGLFRIASYDSDSSWDCPRVIHNAPPTEIDRHDSLIHGFQSCSLICSFSYVVT